MKQKFLIVSTQTFSLGVRSKSEERNAVTGKKSVVFDDLPWIVQVFIQFFNKKIFIIHDEISWIKTSIPMPEHKKSSRSRAIKLLEQHSVSRCGLTGTLISKSPLNAFDPYRFLSASFLKGQTEYQIAEKHCIMMTLRLDRNRRVLISQKEWERVRTRLINAYTFGKETRLQLVKEKIQHDLGISAEHCEHILANRNYMPFLHVDKFMQQFSTVTTTVKREDIFDIKNDTFVYHPMNRFVRLSEKALRIGKELVKFGFTDRLTLGRAASLELLFRLQDVCNGFEPIREEINAETEKERVKYEPFSENPKLEALRDLLEEIDVQENQVVVWCARVNAFDSIVELLEKEGISYACYSGGQTEEQKRESELKADSGEARVFIANPASAGFGLNCLSKFYYMVWYCVGPSVEQYHQAQHRILRGQSTAPRFAYRIFVKNSIEERIYTALELGKELIGATNTQEVFNF